MKGLGASVQAVLKANYTDKTWANYGGKTTVFNAANNGVGLPTTVIGNATGDAFDRFKSFKKADYDTLFKTLASGTIKPIRSIKVAAQTGYATTAELVLGLNLKKVFITVR